MTVAEGSTSRDSYLEGVIASPANNWIDLKYVHLQLYYCTASIFNLQGSVEYPNVHMQQGTVVT